MTKMTKKRPDEAWEWRCIDGNWTKRPAAYCTYHHGVLTEAMMKVHKCTQKECQRLRTEVDWENEGREVER